MKNYLKYSLGLTLFILVALIGMHWLPVITIDGHTMRRVDLLSDIRTPEPEEEKMEADSLPPVPEVKPAFIDTCRTGMTCIEDYSDSTLRGMTPFYRALDEIPMKKRLVRIAVFGDSFIEADIFTADLREMLQKRFGGCGVGFVTITSMTSGYRPTVRHSFGGWSSHAVTDSVYFDRKKQGLSGHYFVPNNNAYVELRGQNKYASLLDTCQQASIFFYNKGAVDLSVRINRGETENRQFEPDGHLQAMQVEGRIGSVRWTVNQADSTLFYGMAMDGTQGIIVDNFSLRGSSGLSLRTIPASIIKEFNEQRPYDLVILQYGLNVATQRGYNYDNYQKGLLTAIEHLKECFPQAGFLLLRSSFSFHHHTTAGCASTVKVSVAACSGADQRILPAAGGTIHAYFLRRLAPLLCERIGQKSLTAEDAPLQTVRHIPTGGAFGNSASVIILSPPQLHRLGFAVLFIVGGELMFAGVAVKVLFADQSFVPMAEHRDIPGINHFCRPPSAAPGEASNR